MRAGFWQIVLVVGLVALFFHRPLLAVLRALGGRRADGGARGGRGLRRVRTCPHCGTANGAEAKFCSACGRPLDFIDV